MLAEQIARSGLCERSIRYGYALYYIETGHDPDVSSVWKLMTRELMLRRHRGKYLDTFGGGEEQCRRESKTMLARVLAETCVWPDERDGTPKVSLNAYLEKKACELRTETQSPDNALNWDLALQDFVNYAFAKIEELNPDQPKEK